MSSINTVKREVIDNEDQLRADMYSFLASLLRAEPTAELVDKLTVLESDDTPLSNLLKH